MLLKRQPHGVGNKLLSFKLDMICILRFGIVFALDFVLCELFLSFMFTIVL